MNRNLVVLGAVVALVFGGTAVLAGYSTAVYLTDGGDKQVIATGGETEIQSGGTLDLQTGATFNVTSTAVTATGTELNLLDGVTSTTAELNILDGVTATAAEINGLVGIKRVYGVFASTAEACTVVATGLDGVADIIGHAVKSDSAYGVDFYVIAAGSLGVRRPGADIYHLVGDSVVVTYADDIPGL